MKRVNVCWYKCHFQAIKSNSRKFPFGGQWASLLFSARGIILSRTVWKIPCGTREIGLIWLQSSHFTDNQWYLSPDPEQRLSQELPHPHFRGETPASMESAPGSSTSLGETWWDWDSSTHPLESAAQLEGFWLEPRGASVVSPCRGTGPSAVHGVQLSLAHRVPHSQNVSPASSSALQWLQEQKHRAPAMQSPPSPSAPAELPWGSPAGAAQHGRSKGPAGSQCPEAPQGAHGGVPTAILCHQAWGSVSQNVVLPWMCWESLLGNAPPSPRLGQPGSDCSEQAWHTHPLFSLFPAAENQS